MCANLGVRSVCEASTQALKKHTPQPDKYNFHLSPFNCCFVALKRELYAEIQHMFWEEW